MEKTITGVTIKAADKGEVSAVFATFNTIDADGDVTQPGAIADGMQVVISAYQHGSHVELGGKLPVGKGVINTSDTEAVMNGRFFMNTTHGRDTFNTVKELGPLQEWSYSLQDVTAKQGEFNGVPVRFLERIGRIKEVSPVLIGVGVNTRTLHTKGAGDKPLPGGVIPVGTIDGVDALRKAHAWVDHGGDPESAGSYGFRHHDAAGAVDLRACMAGVARLKLGTHGVPEQDIPGVFEHLAEHLRDHELEPAPLKTVSFLDELVAAVVAAADVKDSAGRVVALRADKGKQLSRINAEALKWLTEELTELKRLLDTPAEALEREYARYLKNKNKNR